MTVSGLSARVLWPVAATGVFVLSGCASARSPAELSVPTRAQPTPAPDAGREASAAAGPVRLRAALSRADYSPSGADRLYLRIDLAASAAGAIAPPEQGAPAGDPTDAPREGGHTHDLAPPSPPPPPPTPQRPPLSLALLIDRSESMAAGNKFMHALAAANLVIENLTERDVVTVIAFSDEATVLSPAGRVVNRAILRHRLTEIEPAGWTNLSAGLLEAFAQLDAAVPDAPPEGRVKRVVVLTDGQANRGVSEPGALRGLVESARSRGIGVSTMGCGVEYDEKVLRALAEAGGGRYTYVADAEKLPEAMGAEVEGLLAVVAQNARLRVRIVPAPEAGAAGSAMIARVLGRPAGAPALEATIDLGDLRDGESGVFALELAPPPARSGAQTASGAMEVEAELTFDRPDTASRERLVARVAAAMRQPGQAALGDDQAVSLYAAILDAADRAEESAKGMDDEMTARAERDLAALYPAARSVALERRDQELLNAAFVLKHLTEEARAARDAGLTHGHDEARSQLRKDADYRRYLLEHHRDPGP